MNKTCYVATVLLVEDDYHNCKSVSMVWFSAAPVLDNTGAKETFVLNNMCSTVKVKCPSH